MTRSGQRIDGPYVFGLEHVPLPAVVCDGAGRILWANEHFAAQLGDRDEAFDLCLDDAIRPTGGGARLPDLAAQVKGDEGPVGVELGREIFDMYVGPIGDLFAGVFAPRRRDASFSQPPQVPADGERISKEPPTGSQLLEAFILLSGELNLTMREDEIVKLFIRLYEDLFPGRMLCIRLFDPETMGLAQVYANGRLREEMREKIRLTRRAELDVGLDDGELAGLLARAQVEVLDEYEPVFEGSAVGFDVLLYDGTTFYGMLNFEYRAMGRQVLADRPLTLPLAQQMCSALRDARLLTQITVLKDYLEKVLDRANAPVLVVDRDRRIAVVNQAFERQTGHARGDIIGADLMSLLPLGEQTRVLPAVDNAMRGEQKTNIEMRIPGTDGRSVAHLAFNTAPILGGFGELESVIFVGQDLTEIRDLQKQIIHSEKLATLGQVAAGVAHELNNPLTSITVYASYLVNRLGDRIQSGDLEKLRRIVEAADRIQSFTRALVAYARPSEEEPSRIKVSELLGRALSFCEHLVARRRAQVVLDVGEDVPVIYGIRGQLEQVFVNLLTNACHALPEAGGAIRLEARAIADERIRIDISDTGHGIMESDLDAIFEPFYTTKPEGQGTGLGLSIVRNILRNHDAQISVKSEVGKGTTFTVTMYAG